jgi:glycogen debranching enzyme
MLVADELGDIPRDRRRLGLYYRDTRYLSVLELTINGQRPRLMASSCVQDAVCDIQLANPTIESADGTPVLPRTIGLERNRFLDDGLNERLTLYNYNPSAVRVDLTLTLGADFSDIFEVRGFQRTKRGKLAQPEVSDGSARFAYMGRDGVERLTTVLFHTPPSASEVEAGERVRIITPSAFLPESNAVTTGFVSRPPTVKASWQVHLEPRQPVSLTCTKITTDNELFNHLVRRSLLDLRLLLECTPDGLVPDVGVPWFASVFGSQSAIAALQALPLNPEVAVSTLRFLASYQGSQLNRARDEEPGRIVHEIRRGELARTDEIPHGAFYGSVGATPLFLVLFAETMNWLDDDALYQDILPPAKLALQWLAEYGDVDGDGYVEYQTRFLGGVNEKGWPDGRGVIVRAGGIMVEQPVALAEVQGYAYRAMQGMAALLHRRGERRLSQTLKRRAARLKAQFNRDFWLEDERFLAQALDARKRPVPNITSSAARCLFCGIVDEENARYVVTRLSSPEMATGWGIRTLSNRAQNYNPMSYRHGSVWPHENSLIVAGMKSYGYHWEVEEIASQLFEASSFFPYSRLPELFAGFQRDRAAYSIPGEYPASCNPHACAAGTPFLLLQSLLGLQADASAKRIYLSPRLPRWLRHASVENLRVGASTLSLYFDRAGDEEETRFEIRRNEAGVEVVIPPR